MRVARLRRVPWPVTTTLVVLISRVRLTLARASEYTLTASVPPPVTLRAGRWVEKSGVIVTLVWRVALAQAVRAMTVTAAWVTVPG